MRKRFSGEDSVAEQNVRNEYEKQLEDALTQNSQLERLNEGKMTSVADVFYTESDELRSSPAPPPLQTKPLRLSSQFLGWKYKRYL